MNPRGHRVILVLALSMTLCVHSFLSLRDGTCERCCWSAWCQKTTCESFKKACCQAPGSDYDYGYCCDYRIAIGLTWLDSSTLHQPQLSRFTWVFSAASERDRPRYGTGRERSRPTSGIIAEGIPGQFLFGVSRLVLALRVKNVSCHWCCTCRRVQRSAKPTPRYHCSLCHTPKT